MKSVKPLTTHEKITLKEAIANHPKNRVRTRAHAIILSDKGYPIMKLADIFEIKFDTISSWIDQWELNGIMGIYNGIRIGRKPIYTEEEIQLLISFVDEEPHQIKRAQALLEEATGKKSCLDTIKINIKKWLQLQKSTTLIKVKT